MVLYLNLATGFSAGIFGILKQRMWVRTFFSGWVSGTALVWLADAMQVLANEIASTSVVLIFLIVFAASIIVIVLNSYAYIRSKPIIPPPRMFSELS
jgi:hypothetical protein